MGDFSDKAEDYKAEANKGMEKDAREKVKLQCVEAVQKRREEREKKRQFFQNKVQTFQFLFKLDILLKQPSILSLFVAV